MNFNAEYFLFSFDYLQVSVSMEEIQNITKERTVFVVPNAIGIHTDTHKVNIIVIYFAAQRAAFRSSVIAAFGVICF